MAETTRLAHFTKSQQLDHELMEQLFRRADQFHDRFVSCRRLRVPFSVPLLEGHVIALLFYEPSTRTRMTFETAISRLGAKYTSTENASEFSSAIKGETLEDTARVLDRFVDAVIVRHKDTGAADRMAEHSRVPVINGGDGKGQHPTQALLDVYTIHKELGRTDKLKIAFVGDLANGRTAKSLAYLLGKSDRIEMVFVSPPSLKMDDEIKQYLSHHNVSFMEQSTLDDVLPEVDVVYMTRLQKERMKPEEHEAAKAGQLVIDEGNLRLLRPSARILHPLPKVDEILLPFRVEEEDKRVAYFRQVEYAVPIRMALLEHMLRGI